MLCCAYKTKINNYISSLRLPSRFKIYKINNWSISPYYTHTWIQIVFKWLNVKTTRIKWLQNPIKYSKGLNHISKRKMTREQKIKITSAKVIKCYFDVELLFPTSGCCSGWSLLLPALLASPKASCCAAATDKSKSM